MEPMKDPHALPMLIAPRHNGETRIPAVLERTRYLPSSVGGAAGGVKGLGMVDRGKVSQWN